MGPRWLAVLVVASVGVACSSGSKTNSRSDAALFSVRPVIGTALSPCDTTGSEANGTIVPTRTPIDGASCLRLGSPVVVAGDVARSFAGSDPTPAGTVNIELDPAGSRAFDDYAAKHAGATLAIVAQGVVVSAPKLNSASYHGHLVFTTDPDAASRFLAAMKKRG